MRQAGFDVAVEIGRQPPGQACALLRRGGGQAAGWVWVVAARRGLPARAAPDRGA